MQMGLIVLFILYVKNQFAWLILSNAKIPEDFTITTSEPENFLIRYFRVCIELSLSTKRVYVLPNDLWAVERI